MPAPFGSRRYASFSKNRGPRSLGQSLSYKHADRSEVIPNRKKSGELFLNLLDLRGLVVAARRLGGFEAARGPATRPDEYAPFAGEDAQAARIRGSRNSGFPFVRVEVRPSKARPGSGRTPRFPESYFYILG